MEQDLRGGGSPLKQLIDVAAERFKVPAERLGLELELAAGVVPFASAAGYGAQQNADSDTDDKTAGESSGIFVHATCSPEVDGRS